MEKLFVKLHFLQIKNLKSRFFMNTCLGNLLMNGLLAKILIWSMK